MTTTELKNELNKVANNKKILYHGGRKKFTKIYPKYMFIDSSNAQEGIGIYFTPYLEVAQKYGKHVMFIEIEDFKKFIDSYAIASDVYKLYEIEKVVDLIKVNDKDELYYYITNWMEIDYDSSVDELKEAFKSILPDMLENEIRNFHVELAEIFGVEEFVNAWNKVFGNRFYGTYNPKLEFYAVMNTKIKVNVLM